MTYFFYKSDLSSLLSFCFISPGSFAKNSEFKLIHKHKPLKIINYGTAGSLKKKLSGIVECTKFYQRDMDVRGLLDLKLGQTPFDNINEIINSDEGYSCGSGDSFVNKQIEMEVDLVDMEAYALAKVCKLEGLKFRCFKYVEVNML